MKEIGRVASGGILLWQLHLSKSVLPLILITTFGGVAVYMYTIVAETLGG